MWIRNLGAYFELKTMSKLGLKFTETKVTKHSPNLDMYDVQYYGFLQSESYNKYSVHNLTVLEHICHFH